MLFEGTVCQQHSWFECLCKAAPALPGAAHATEAAASVDGTQPVFTGAVPTHAASSQDAPEASRSKRKAADTSQGNCLLKYFKPVGSIDQQKEAVNAQGKQDRTGRKQDCSGQQQQVRSTKKQDRSNREQDRSTREQDREQGRSTRAQDREQDRSTREQDREQDRSTREQDRSTTEQDRSRRGLTLARERTQKDHVDPFMLDQTPLALFSKRYNLPVRSGLDNHLRTFADAPENMPPISCLLQGCEEKWFTNLGEFFEHCDAVHEGYHTYRLRVLHLLSREVWQFPGSLQRAALQNFSEFQVRGATDWDNFTTHMHDKLSLGKGLQRDERWGPRRFVACVVCAERRWSEELIPTSIAGAKTEFQKEDKVCLLLDPKLYVSTWPELPSEEVFKSCPTVLLQTGDKVQMLLHKRRVTKRMCTGEEQAPLCKECRRCLVKNPPEMPARALANGKWLGRHPELMRRMPYGHRMLLPLRRVILTKVFFTANSKNPWEQSHSAFGLDGVTTIVEQAPTLPAIKEFPPRDLAESFEAVFVGIDPQDMRKKQTFPISKTLLLKQFDFVQRNSKAHQAAICRKADVEEWIDGETPEVLQKTFVDAPVEELDEEEVEELAGRADSNKYRGPVDSTLGAQELLESSEDVPVSYHCPDTVPLDKSTCWQVAAAKLEEMEKLAAAIQTEEELAEFIKDKPRRSVLYQTAAEFRKAVGQVSASETRKHIEKAICSEPLSKEHGDASPAREEPVAGVETEAQFTADDNPKLVVPTGKAYAKMWEPGFWQEWNPMDWCYGDCVYGDERLNDKPYKRTSFQEIAKHWLLREELEYDLYEGENYVAEHGEPKLWEHQPDVELLLKQLEEAEQQRPRVSCSGRVVPFAVNRFCMHPVNIMVIATFWRMMSGFMAVNVGLRIPGIQTKLKSLAQLPDQLALLSSKEGEADGMMGLVRRTSHLFNLVMGKVVGSNGYRVACRHKFTAYTIFFGAPLIFCTPNIADNRNILILLCQGAEINLDIDADPDLKLTYEDLRLRVVNDPVGQCVVVELLLRLFVLHILGASPDCVAQPEGVTVEHRVWTSDGVAASLTSLGCLVVLQAARGELEASGRGSLHGHWEIWGVSLTMQTAIEQFADKPLQEKHSCLKNVVSQWINFFQRTHHSSVEHLPKVFGQATSAQPMIVTQDMLHPCRMDGGEENLEGYRKQRRPCVTEVPKMDLPKRLPPDDLYEPADASFPETSAEPMKKRLIRGQALTAMPSYRRIHTLTEGRASEAELDTATWLPMYLQDAWQVQARAMLHVCGPSCWKYNKTGTRVCRHHCYHITVLEPDETASVPADKPIKLRRDGRPLNNQLYIIEESGKGKRGRICPVVVCPFETVTNYVAAVSLRCNFDNQSLVYLPPASTLPLEWLPNIRAKPELAWMARKTGDLEPKSLVAPQKPEPLEVSADSTWLESLLQEFEQETQGAFQDAHNQGFYINEYTTKVHALGDKLMQGLQRIAQKIHASEADGSVEKLTTRQRNKERVKMVLKKLVHLMNSLQVKSGSELVFPMLFDHMSFATHRCWETNLKVAYAKTLSAWQDHFKGSLKALHEKASVSQSIGFLLPSLQSGRAKELPVGWLIQPKPHDKTLSANAAATMEQVEQETGEDHGYIYISPGGQRFTSLQQALQYAQNDKLRNRMAADMKAVQIDSFDHNSNIQVQFTSNHEDYMHRGEHPIMQAGSWK